MDTNKIKPLHHSVIIESYSGVEKTSSGFIISKTNDTNVPTLGTVVRTSEDSDFKVGDIVLFTRFAAFECKLSTEVAEDKKVWLLKDEEVLALYEGELPKVV